MNACTAQKLNSSGTGCDERGATDLTSPSTSSGPQELEAFYDRSFSALIA